MVVLDELNLTANRLFKLGLVKALEEEATLVTEHLGLDEVDVRNTKWGCFQLIDLFFKNVL